jgi:hypothetical protein
MKRISIAFVTLISLSTLAAANSPSGPAELDGHWKLDWDRSDSFAPVMKALEVPWLLRKLAGVASVGLELRALPPSADCEDCSQEMMVTLSSPISTNETRVVFDGEPRPGEDPRGRDTIDRYTWSAETGMEMIRELELPSGKQARLQESRVLGESKDTLLSTLRVWIDGAEQASVNRTFMRESD